MTFTSCFGDPLSILYHDLNLDSYRKAFGKNESKKMVIRWSKLDLLKVVQNAVQLPDGLMDFLKESSNDSPVIFIVDSNPGETSRLFVSKWRTQWLWWKTSHSCNVLMISNLKNNGNFNYHLFWVQELSCKEHCISLSECFFFIQHVFWTLYTNIFPSCTFPKKNSLGSHFRFFSPFSSRWVYKMNLWHWKMPSAHPNPNSQEWLVPKCSRYEFLIQWNLQNLGQPKKNRPTIPPWKFSGQSIIPPWKKHMVSPRHHSHAATLDGTADLTALTFPEAVAKTASQAAAMAMAPTSARAISCAVKEASEKPRSSQTFLGHKKIRLSKFWEVAERLGC